MDINKKGTRVNPQASKENNSQIVHGENKIDADISELDLQVLKNNDFFETTKYLYKDAKNKLEFCKAILQFYLRLFNTKHGSYLGFEEKTKINLNTYFIDVFAQLKTNKIVSTLEYVEIINLTINVYLDIYDSQIKILKTIKKESPDLIEHYSKEIGSLDIILGFLSKISEPAYINFDNILLRLSKHLSQPGVFTLSKSFFELAMSKKTLNTFAEKLTIADIII
jgi:hypothetical protein